VIIDTGGVNPFDPEEMRRLAAQVTAADVEPVLVLPAGGDAREMAEAAAEFAAIGARRIIVTRLDAARRIGGVLTAAEGAGLAIADASITPFVGEGLHPLTAPVLARILLRDPNRPHDRSAFVGSPA
jgi:flagellar biosynthesis protein FlhF